MRLLKLFLIIVCAISLSANNDKFHKYAKSGNKKINGFIKATNLLLSEVYKDKKDKKTLYCQASFDNEKRIIYPNGYSIEDNDLNNKIEWEHVVPADFFGRRCDGWQNSERRCVSASDKKISNRNCAIKTNPRFLRMFTDLYNIYPAIARINRQRKNYKFIDGDASISNISKISSLFFDDKLKREFGNCEFIIKNQRVIPSNISKGIIARTYLYMSDTYKKECRISKEQKKLFDKWNKDYPVTKNECHRAKLISKLQGNHNKIVKKLCEKDKLYK